MADHVTTALDVVDCAPAAPPRAQGRCIRPAHDCYYPPHVQPTDLMHVDFDVQEVDASGLYLVEEVSAGRVTWRGCREFRRWLDTGRVEMDATGAGRWVDAAHVQACGWRIAGKVVQVVRATGDVPRLTAVAPH